MVLTKKQTPKTLTGFPFYFDSLFDHDWKPELTVPKVNIKETEDDYTLEFAVPGKKKKDFNIQLENDQLIVSSQDVTSNVEKEQETYYRKEFSFNAFKRSFKLPDNEIDSGKIEAYYQEGILNIKLPKREEAKPIPPKSITIS